MKRKLLIATLLATIVIVLFVRVNLVRYEESSGLLLWNDSEAYLLVSFSATGFRLSLLDYYALEPLKEYFYAPNPGTDQTGAFTIMRITPTGVESYEPKHHLALQNITPLADGIYAECGGRVCKLTGMDFREVSKEEEQKIGGENRLTRDDFSNVNGWSRRRFWGSPAREPGQPWAFSASLKDGTKLTVSGGNPLVIDLKREGQPPRRIWYQKQGIQKIRSAAYERIFRQP